MMNGHRSSESSEHSQNKRAGFVVGAHSAVCSGEAPPTSAPSSSPPREEFAEQYELAFTDERSRAEADAWDATVGDGIEDDERPSRATGCGAN